jgi:RNA polymerase sigma factor (sigma-70 family)
MPAGQLEGVIRHLRQVAHRDESAPVTDAQLLERFVCQRDEAAFAQLVHRHGPMVLGVCRRVLGNEADAEDAFQATFLVLVSKAPVIVPRNQVANWLHGVAHKTALKAKAMNTKRRVKEREAGAVQGRHPPRDTGEPLLEILDGELNALPEKYRAPIVLCDLEGLSYRDAAARLGCPQGTLSGRLTRARSLLARRLARRCLPGTLAALPALLARAATAPVPRSLRACTLRAGSALAQGQALTEIALSSRVARLTQGVLKMLLLSKVQAVTSGLLILAAAVLAGAMCLSWETARAAGPEDDPAGRVADDRDALPGPARTANRPTESPEAAFEFRGADRGGKTVSLVVAGTSAPVLCLPIQDEVRVLIGGRLGGIDDLQPGSRIAIRLDPANRVIQDIRALERPEKPVVLQSVRDLAHIATPSEGEVLRALPRVPREAPTTLQAFRDDIQVVTEQLAKQVDPPRLFPLVGKAELHRYHWKCTVYYTETVESSYPFPLRSKRPRVEVVYITRDYLVPTR